MKKFFQFLFSIKNQTIGLKRYKIIRFLGIKIKLKTSGIIAVAASDVCLWEKMIFSQEIFKLKNIDPKKHTYIYEYIVHPFFVRAFKNGICRTNREEIFISAKEVVKENTQLKCNPMIGTAPLDLTNIKKYKGKVVNLSLSGLENNYYHWCLECLGRFYLVKKSGVKPDYYIISTRHKFQREYLEILGIKPEQIIEADCNELIMADELIAPSNFVANYNEVDSRGFVTYHKIWLPHWIGNIYKEEILPKYEGYGYKKFI